MRKWENSLSPSAINHQPFPSIPLGVSAWCFNGFLPESVRTIVDGGAPLNADAVETVRAYFCRLTDLILGSSIRTLELWYSDALFDQVVAVSLDRLAADRRISSMHAPFGPARDLGSPDEEVRRIGVEGCKRAASLLSRFKGQVLVVHGGSAAPDSSMVSEHIRQSARSIREIADFCSDLGIEVAAEMLTGLAVGSSADDLLRLMELVDRPNAGFCIDVNHVFPADRLVPSVHALGSRLLTLHISDYDGEQERHWLPGAGIIDWQAFIGALREVGYRGAFMYEARFDATDIRQAALVIEQNYRELMAFSPP